MADHPDAFGPDEPSPLPEGEFKSNFFETMGAAESAPAPLAPQPRTLADFPPAPPEPAARHPLFPVVLGVGFVLVIVVAATVSALSSSSTTTTAGPPAAAAPAAPPATESTAKEADLKALEESLKAQIASLSKNVKELDERVTSLPKPAPAPDLAPLNAKVAALSKSLDAVAPLSKKVDALDDRLSGLNTSVKSLQDGTSSLKDQVASLRSDLKQRETAAGSEPSTRESAKPANVNVEGQSFAQAAELFKAGKYKEASAILKTTEENDPKDARVWYYAALSSGMATNQWQPGSDAAKFVMKGVEREKAGTPSSPEIDAEFSKIPASLKPWLAGYRTLARKP